MPVSKRWRRTLGIEPVDALMVRTLLAELGIAVRPARLVRIIVDHAIAVDAPALGETPLRQDGSLNRRVKAFFEAPAASFVAIHNTRMAGISRERNAMKAELSAIMARIWPS